MLSRRPRNRPEALLSKISELSIGLLENLAAFYMNKFVTQGCRGNKNDQEGGIV